MELQSSGQLLTAADLIKSHQPTHFDKKYSNGEAVCCLTMTTGIIMHCVCTHFTDPPLPPVRSLSRGSKKGVFLVLKLRVSISSKVDHDSLVSSKMEKP